MNLIKKVRERLDNVKKHGWGVLDLRSCGLEEIPQEVFDYDWLVNIDFGNYSYSDDATRNKIKIIPDEISRLKNLARLNVSNNHVTHISEKLSSLKKIGLLKFKQQWFNRYICQSGQYAKPKGTLPGRQSF